MFAELNKPPQNNFRRFSSGGSEKLRRGQMKYWEIEISPGNLLSRLINKLARLMKPNRSLGFGEIAQT